MRRRIHENRDWGSADLDEEGLALQAELEQRQSVGGSNDSQPHGIVTNALLGSPAQGYQVILDVLR